MLSLRLKFNSFIGVLIWIWTVLVISADLKVTIFDYVHWLITLGLLVVLLPFLFGFRYKLEFSSLLGFMVFITAIVVAGITSSVPGYSLIQAIKLIFILGALMFFIGQPTFAEYAFRACVFSVFLNLAFIGLGLYSLSFYASEMAVGRWGTLLNYPGSLWKVGILVFVYSGYLTAKKGFINKYFVLLLASLLLIYFDGSRTAVILLLIGILYLFLILIKESKLKTVTFCTASAVLILAMLTGVFVYSRCDKGSAETLRALKMVDDLSGYGLFSGLEATDIIRFHMLQTAINSIKEHPIQGTGIGTTTVETKDGPMVVHNTYLQTWADLGLIGFLSYAWIVFGWMIWLPMALKRIQNLSDLNRKALYYNAIFILFLFALAGIFHPLSTEWSEWIIFIVPYALFFEIIKCKKEPIY